jgi:hypothetical protein
MTPLKEPDKDDQPRQVATEVVASVPILQKETPPTDSSGGSTLTR